MSKSDLIDIDVSRHAETDKAWFVSTTGRKADAKWVPKSQAELEDKPTGVRVLTLPEWLAIDKGFV
jgi:hypothetical protein